MPLGLTPESTTLSDFVNKIYPRKPWDPSSSAEAEWAVRNVLSEAELKDLQEKGMALPRGDKNVKNWKNAKYWLASDTGANVGENLQIRAKQSNIPLNKPVLAKDIEFYDSTSKKWLPVEKWRPTGLGRTPVKTPRMGSGATGFLQGMLLDKLGFFDMAEAPEPSIDPSIFLTGDPRIDSKIQPSGKPK